MDIFGKLISVMLLTAATLGTADAQSSSFGTTWSFSGIGISYDRIDDNGMILHAGLELELSENFLGRRGEPGISGSVAWSRVIGQTESRNGNTVLFHAGPGIMAGYCKDFRVEKGENQAGIAFGLMGRIGTTIVYDRNINISICLAPMIGVHLTSSDENTNMKYYRYGLLRALMPEIGIQYRF